jgi:ATP-independent RNA helicase DbpA
LSQPANFSSLALPQGMIDNLDQMGYLNMTPIQAEALPFVIEGRDVLAKAQTGSGKTAAFGIGILAKLNQRNFGCQALILCPTRELATQVADEIRTLARYQQNIKILTLCGGQSIGPQIGSLEHGAHIVVGTPGRIADHINKGTLDLNAVETVVLDEADRMLDMGFVDEITKIISHTPYDRQMLLFSATYPEGIQALSKEFQHEPETITIKDEQSKSTIIQRFYDVPKMKDKDEALLTLLGSKASESTVIFCNTKIACYDVLEFLRERGYHALALIGEMEQRERDQVLVRFSNKSAAILIATDVASRGLDIDDLDLVINYDVTRDPEVHVHRIGRTGRAGKEGLALSLMAASEVKKMFAINEYMNTKYDTSDISKLKSPYEPKKPNMVTLCIDGGKKSKLRPGDILGALTAGGEVPGTDVGKINMFPNHAYVAVARPSARIALRLIQEQNMKGRRFRVRRL